MEEVTQINYALNTNNLNLIRELIDAGDSFSEIDENVIRILSNVIIDNNLEMLKLLIELSVNYTRNYKYQHRIMLENSPSKARVRYLALLDKQHVEAINKFEYTALMNAIIHNRPKMVELLIEEAGVDINLRNDEGKNALDIAKETGNSNIINLIYSYIQASSLGLMIDDTLIKRI